MVLLILARQLFLLRIKNSCDRPSRLLLDLFVSKDVFLILFHVDLSLVGISLNQLVVSLHDLRRLVLIESNALQLGMCLIIVLYLVDVFITQDIIQMATLSNHLEVVLPLLCSHWNLVK